MRYHNEESLSQYSTSRSKKLLMLKIYFKTIENLIRSNLFQQSDRVYFIWIIVSRKCQIDQPVLYCSLSRRTQYNFEPLVFSAVNNRATLEMDGKMMKMFGLNCGGGDAKSISVRTLYVAPVKADVSEFVGNVFTPFLK